MTRYIVLVLVAGLLLAADVKKDDAKKDQETLQGIWKVVSAEGGGKDQTEKAKDHTLTFDKDTFTLKKGDELRVKGTFKIDPTKKPKTIDMTITEARRDEDKGKEVHGIYDVTKDELKWCTAEPGDKGRPKEFATKEGTPEMLITFKKEKK